MKDAERPLVLLFPDSSVKEIDPTATEPARPRPAGTGQSVLRRVFRSSALGSCVLRVSIYLVLAYAINFALREAGRPWIRDLLPFSPAGLAVAEANALIGSVAAAWVMSRLEDQPFGVYGLPARQALGRNFLWGVFLGLAEVSTVMGLLAALGFYHFGPLAVRGREVLQWVLVWAAVFLLVSLSEEFAFRGYAQFTLALGMGFWPAAFLLSFLFGLAHLGNPGETRLGIAGIVLTGLFWCFTLRRTGTLWLAVGMHASFDFGETFLYSVPDSGVLLPGHLSNAVIRGPAWATGGNAGPEGSVFDSLALLILFLVVQRMYPVSKEGQPTQAQQERQA